MIAIEQGVINKTTSKRMQQLEQQIEDIEKQIVIERSKINLKISEEEIREFYETALKQEPLILIEYLVKEIKLYNDKVEITFNNPIMKSPNDKGFSFFIDNRIEIIINNKEKFGLTKMQVEFYL